MIAFAVLRQQRWAIQRRVSYRLLKQQPNSIRNPVPKKIGFFVLSANATRVGQRYTNCQTGGTEDERVGENDSSKIQNWFLKKTRTILKYISSCLQQRPKREKCISIWKCGRVRFIAPVLKTDEPKGSVSSNLTASAK